MASRYESPDTPLEKISSNTVPTTPRNDAEPLHAPIEAHSAAGPSILAEEAGLTRKPQKSMLIFKRLRKELPLPGPKMLWWMTCDTFFLHTHVQADI